MNSADSGNERLSPDQSGARQIARRLISLGGAEQRGSRTAPQAVFAAGEYLYRDLSRWLGPDGCHALFRRALAEALTDYPVLGQIQLRARSEPYLEGVAETIMAHGAAATAEALESMLVRLIELLGRLIGDDMATKLIEGSLAEPARGDANPARKRGKA